MNKFKQPRNSGRIVFLRERGTRRVQVVKSHEYYFVDVWSKDKTKLSPEKVFAPFHTLEDATKIAKTCLGEGCGESWTEEKKNIL
jgi:hypothetical protein